jgi:2-keto-3-deoxy-L-rhamnonate aldolase RhmA
VAAEYRIEILPSALRQLKRWLTAGIDGFSKRRNRMKPNRLRELLRDGKPTVGTHVIVPWPGIVEIVGHTGAFDYIEYVGEYSSFTPGLLEEFGRALDLFPGMSSMMKVEEQTRGFIAQRAIDAGIQNVLFTDCRSADDVRECIRLVRPETPDAGGIHGYGMRRTTVYGTGLAGPGAGNLVEEWTRAMNEVVVAVMIEKKGAIEDLEAILSVEGLDMVQFGPSDYSISIGKPGQGGGAEIQKIQRDMIELAMTKGVAPRVEVGSFEQAQPYLEMGVRHLCIGWDTLVVAQWCRQQGEGIQALMGGG